MPNYCFYCHKVIESDRLFCSNICRDNGMVIFEREVRNQSGNRLFYVTKEPRYVKCPICAKEFPKEYHSSKKYCSIECRRKAKEERNKLYWQRQKLYNKRFKKVSTIVK